MVRTPLAAFFNSPIHSLRTFGINRLIGAIPFGPTETINRVQPLVDHLKVLYMPDPFVAVGAHYQHFPQIEEQHNTNHQTPGHVRTRLSDIPRDRTTVVYCSGGYRSSKAASLLEHRHFLIIINLTVGL